MNESTLSGAELKQLNKETYSKADQFTEPILGIMFLFGLFIAFFYDTWIIALGIGGLNVLAYYSAKKILPQSNLYQYILSAVSAIFAAQYIYQMHGMAEMHFWVFISSTTLILYQNWRLQIPLIILVIIHHGSFAYLQFIGYREIYFTQLAYMDLTTFLFHGVLASCVTFIAGVWSYNLEQRTLQDARNLKEITGLQSELQKSVDRANDLNQELANINEAIQNKNENLNTLVEDRAQVIAEQNKKLMHHAFVSAHQVRSPLARILGLVNLMKHETAFSEPARELYNHLEVSANELDDILREVRTNLDDSNI
jgi:two-component system sensor histidine kinase/response regulator